jgi:AsmA protein
MAAAKPAPGLSPHRWVWKLLSVLLGLVGFALLLLVMLPYVISLEHVKGPIIARVEAALQRKVEVGAVRLQILSGLGLGLEDLTIYNAPGWRQPYFIKAGTLSVKVAWQPLLRRQVEITRILLRDGEIMIERDAQGRLNFADLAAAKSAAAKALPTPAARSSGGHEASPGSNPLARLLVSKAALHEMRITFVDRMVVPGQEVTTTASHLQLNVSDVALGAPIPFDMAATLLADSGHNIRLQGHVGPIAESSGLAGAPLDVQLQATEVLVDKLAPYLGAEFPFVRGRLGGNLNVRGSIDQSLRINGTLALADAVVREPIAHNASAPLPTLMSAPDLTIDLATGRADLTDVQINLANLQATIKGVVEHFTTTPQLDLRVTTTPFAPAELLTQVPMLGSILPAPTELRGTVQLQATVKGAPGDLRSQAQVDLHELALRSGSLNGGARDAGGILLETDDTQAALTMHLMTPQPPSIQMDVRARRLVFDRRTATAPPPRQEAAPGPTSPGPTPQAPQAQPMAPPVTLNGRVNIAEGRIHRVHFQQLTADLSLVNGLLQSTQRMQLYAGSYQGALQADLTPLEPSYTLNARVADLDVGRAMDELTSVKKVLLGVLNADLHLTGQGLTWELLNQTLNGDGSVNITEARLTHFDLLPKLMQALQSVAGLAGLTIGGDWEQDALRTIEGDWHLRQGKILTDHLRLRGKSVEALLRGHMGLDQALNYEGNLFLPAKFIARRGTPSLLRQDDMGRVVLPFTVKGTVTAPRVALREKALAELAGEALADKMKKQLSGKLEGLLDKPSASEQQSQESDKAGQETGDRPKRHNLPRKILEELLRR